MIQGYNRRTTVRAAICAALFCSTSGAFAQDITPVPAAQPTSPVATAQPVVEQPPISSAAADTVVPPPVVRTIPDDMLDKPIGAGDVKAAVQRNNVPKTLANRLSVRTDILPNTAPVAGNNEKSLAPAIDAAVPPTSSIEDTASIAPVDTTEFPQADTAQATDSSEGDWAIYGGLAALALTGLGAAFASRRRRAEPKPKSKPEQQPDPRMPIAAKPDADITPVRAMQPRSAFSQMSMPSQAARDLPPITDPLFAHKVELAAITDPLFAHQVDLPPVTDPMFAYTQEFAGPTPSSLDKRRDWQSSRDEERKPLHAFEPAE